MFDKIIFKVFVFAKHVGFIIEKIYLIKLN